MKMHLIPRRILGKAVRNYRKSRSFIKIDIVKEFSLFAPSSSGTYRMLANQTTQEIKLAFPSLARLVSSIGEDVSIIPIQQFCNPSNIENANRFKKLSDLNGSDKSNDHNYHFVYGEILSSREKKMHILEIGIGSNNLDIVSNMGLGGTPGASLRTFRDFCANSEVIGADIDERILFNETRISTTRVDQTDQESLMQFQKNFPVKFDLIVDDGLHSPLANISTLELGMKTVKSGGWIVIEDIPQDAISLWQVIKVLMPQNYVPYILQDGDDFAFALQKTND
jgi:hypothetical protein